MPELPEVETTLRGLRPFVENELIVGVEVSDPRLRWAVPDELGDLVPGQRIGVPWRRAKYLIFPLSGGQHLLIHLGMSGSLRLVPPETPRRPHDHVEFVLSSGLCLRYHDPRRFGCVLLIENPEKAPLLSSLGPEPLGPLFDGDWLYVLSRGRSTSIKSFIMDGRIVVGVGNIYANEALFDCGILPEKAAGRLSRARLQRLAESVRLVLSMAIQQGGTTLRDFVGATGTPGYFRQVLAVYDRAGQPCRRCGTNIRQSRLSQRSTFWCPLCQR